MIEGQNWKRKENFYKKHKDEIRNGFGMFARPKAPELGANHVQSAWT